MELYPELPKRGSVTGANAKGSKNDCPRPVPPSLATRGLIWSARCVLPGKSSEVPLAVTENGVPLINPRMLLICHPPSRADHSPPLARRFPFPNGSSHTFVI